MLCITMRYRKPLVTPQLRLMIVMSGCAVRTMEKNLAKKKVPDLVEDVEG